MCCKSKGLSRLGVFFGLVALCTLVVAFVGGTWLYTKEPVQLPKSELTTSISFRIGLWRVCPSLKRINSSIHMPSPACSLVKYSGWDDVKSSDLGVWAPLDLAPVFIARMRVCTVLSGAAVALILFGFFFSLLGHCIGDNKTLIASGMYILGALLLGAGLMAFASVLSETVTEATQYHRDSPAGPAYDYRYGWCFFTAGAAFIMSKMAAVFSLSGYLNRFSSVDEMVRVMVPGADRKLREHQSLTAEYIERHQRHHRHPHMGPSNRPQYDALCTKEHAGSYNKYEQECGPLLNKTPPDVCTMNKSMEFPPQHGIPSCVDIDCALLPPDPNMLNMGISMGMQTSPGGVSGIEMRATGHTQSGTLAGQTVPIQIKSNHQTHALSPDGQPGLLMYAGGVPPPANFANTNKYGTMPHPGFHSIPAAEIANSGASINTGPNTSYCKSSTLQHPRGRKKCVKIETFHPSETGFADFTLKRTPGSGAAATSNYSGSAV